MDINTVEDIAKLKQEYGDDIQDNIESLKYITDTSMEEKEVYFTNRD